MNLAEAYPAGSPLEARAFGETFYFTGSPCKRGHLSTRYASTAQCSQCIAERPRATPEASREASIKHYAKVRDVRIVEMRNWREQNPEVAKEAADDWRSRNPNASKDWFARNPGKKAAYWAKYAQSKRQACPAWLTPEQHNEIAAFYTEAARLTDETGIPHEVDHEVPLNGRNVCGLHVPWNLQVLTEEDNRRKGNTA